MAMPQTISAYVALGANLGDPVLTVSAALDALRELAGVRGHGASGLYLTAPVGLRDQPDFINAVMRLEIDAARPELGTAAHLLEELFVIEARFGRQRSVPNAPRTLDLDLLLFGERTSDDPRCQLPHPRLHERLFVLAPLAEIAPDLIIPGHGRVTALRDACLGQRVRRLEVADTPR